MALKRFGIYLSATDDALLVREMARNNVYGRKAKLLRSYALLGYQRAVKLCDDITDQTALTQALAKEFSAGNTPDYRAASEFLRLRGAGAVRPASAQATPPASAPLPPATDSAQGPVDEAPPKPKAPWGGLKNLIGEQSKEK